MVEDVLQASLPGVVNVVRIADIGQGTNPVRVVSMRALADQPGHKDYPREEWVGLDQDSKVERTLPTRKLMVMSAQILLRRSTRTKRAITWYAPQPK